MLNIPREPFILRDPNIAYAPVLECGITHNAKNVLSARKEYSSRPKESGKWLAIKRYGLRSKEHTRCEQTKRAIKHEKEM